MGIKVHTGESNGYSPGAYYKSSGPAIINVNSEEELEKWAKVLDLSKKELLEAIEVYGPEVKYIRLGLRAQKEGAA